MKNEFTNRLGTFRTTLDYLDRAAIKLLWQFLPPVRFTQRVTEATNALSALAEFCQKQASVLTGSAADKAREEKEVEDAAFVLGQAVGECCGSLGSLADAARCAFPLSAWRRMRNAHLLATAREVIATAQSLLGTHPAEAGECGITLDAVNGCKKEADDYEAVITAPQQDIAGRKGLTTQLRDRFNAVEAIFTSMDGLIDQFPDKDFVEAYKATRVVRDLGHGPGTPPPPPPPTPPA